MILQQLKEQTSEHHFNLEQSGHLAHFKEKTITLPLYLTILKKFYGYYSPLEKELDRHSSLRSYLPDYETRRKSNSIIEDLSLLGSSPAADSDIEMCDDLPQLTNLSQAFGCLYVLEGSTLGGRIISKILQDQLQLDENTGGRYFNGYGPLTGEKWKTFGAAITHYNKSVSDEEAIIEGANQTFIKLKNWLERV